MVFPLKDSKYTPMKVKYPANLTDLKQDLEYSVMKANLFYGSNFYHYDPLVCFSQFALSPLSCSTPEVESRYKLKRYSRRGPPHDWVDTDVGKYKFVTRDWILGEVVHTSVDDDPSPSDHSPIKRMQMDTDDGGGGEELGEQNRCRRRFGNAFCKRKQVSDALYCAKHNKKVQRQES